MTIPRVCSIVILFCCAGCGDSFVVPGAGASNSTSPGGCTPGTSSECPAVQGSVLGVAFNYTAQAGFASCQDSNGVSSTRIVITDSSSPCDGIFVEDANGWMENGTRTVVLELGSPTQNSFIGAYATSNGALLIPNGVPDTVSDPNGVQDPNVVGDSNSVQNPNIFGNPNSVQNPNAVGNPNGVGNPNSLARLRAIRKAQLPPHSLAATLPNPQPLTVDNLSLDVSTGTKRAGIFEASDGNAALRGSFNAVSCPAANICAP